MTPALLKVLVHVKLESKNLCLMNLIYVLICFIDEDVTKAGLITEASTVETVAQVN